MYNKIECFGVKLSEAYRSLTFLKNYDHDN